MKLALLFCGGVLLGLVAEYLLWEGPVWVAYEDWWFSIRSTRIIGLGLIVLGAEAAAVAAFCLSCVFWQRPAQTSMPLSRPAPAAVWGRPVLPICSILFFLAAASAFLRARDGFDTLEVMESVPDGYSRDIIDSFRFRGQVAQTFGILYSIVGSAILVAPMLLKSRGWQLSQRISWPGCGISLVGHFLGAVGFLLWFGNGLAMEGAKDSVSLVANLGVLGGIGLVVFGNTAAAVRGPSPSTKRDLE